MTANDSTHVARHDDHQLREFLAARRRGDVAGATRWWDELLTDNVDRVRGMVQAESWGRLSPAEQEDAHSAALLKIAVNMMETFLGTSMGEWVESVRTLVWGVCIDTQRSAARISARQTSFDGVRSQDLDDDRDPWDGPSRAAYDERESMRESEEADQELQEHGRGFFDWALPRLSDKRRAVIDLDRQGVPVDEIQSRLGMTRDAVYQSRHRGMQDLVKLRDQYLS